MGEASSVCLVDVLHICPLDDDDGDDDYDDDGDDEDDDGDDDDDEDDDKHDARTLVRREATLIFGAIR